MKNYILSSCRRLLSYSLFWEPIHHYYYLVYQGARNRFLRHYKLCISHHYTRLHPQDLLVESSVMTKRIYVFSNIVSTSYHLNRLFLPVLLAQLLPITTSSPHELPEPIYHHYLLFLLIHLEYPFIF